MIFNFILEIFNIKVNEKLNYKSYRFDLNLLYQD